MMRRWIGLCAIVSLCLGSLTLQGVDTEIDEDDDQTDIFAIPLDSSEDEEELEQEYLEEMEQEQKQQDSQK